MGFVLGPVSNVRAGVEDHYLQKQRSVRTSSAIKLSVVWIRCFWSLAMDDIGDNKNTYKQASLSHSAMAFLDSPSP